MNQTAFKNFRKVLVIVAIAAFSLSACSNSSNSAPTNSQSADGMMESAMPDTASSLSEADIMFLQMMIPHHEQAIEMSKLATTNTKNPEVLDLAARIEAAQQPEIDLMNKLLSDAGQSVMPGHSMGHGMGDNGMMDEADMDTLAAAKDSAFDVLYLSGMIAHHDGAIAMAGVVAESSNLAVNTLAKNIVSSQAVEIAEMTKLLAAAS